MFRIKGINWYDIQSIWAEPDERLVGSVTAVSNDFLVAITNTTRNNALKRCTSQEKTIGGDIDGSNSCIHSLNTAHSFSSNSPKLKRVEGLSSERKRNQKYPDTIVSACGCKSVVRTEAKEPDSNVIFWRRFSEDANFN